MEINIKNKFNNETIVSGTYSTFKQGLEKNRNQLAGADLKSLDLRFVDLRYADLRDADLSFSNLSKAKLRGADLEGANLEGAILDGTDFSRANLKGANYVMEDLGKAKTKEAFLSGSSDFEKSMFGRLDQKAIDALTNRINFLIAIIVALSAIFGFFYIDLRNYTYNDLSQYSVAVNGDLLRTKLWTVQMNDLYKAKNNFDIYDMVDAQVRVLDLKEKSKTHRLTNAQYDQLAESKKKIIELSR